MSRLFGTALAIAAMLAAASAAAVPNVIHFSGRLAVAGGSFTGTQPVTFALYDGKDAGVALWTETQSVSVNANHFHVLLGVQVSFDPTTFDTGDLYLGITVAGDEEMTPRVRLASVPYALRAAGLSCTGCVEKTHLQDGLFSNVAFSGDYNELVNVPDLAGFVSGNGTTGTIPRFDSSATLADSAIVDVDGNVGIGTTEPAAMLDVAGGVRIGNDASECTSANAGTLRWTGTLFEGCDGSTWQSLSALSGTCLATDTTCDNKDDDCDGDNDDDYVSLPTSCGVGACAAEGLSVCTDGQVFSGCTPKAPLSSNDATCDGVDDDCNGNSDEDYTAEVTSCGTGLCVNSGSTSCVGGVVQDSCLPLSPPSGYDANCSLASCPANAGGAPNCTCNAGYSGSLTWNTSSQSWGGSCANIDDCSPNPCGTGGDCTDLVGAFSCACDPGYDGGGTNIPCTCTPINGGWSGWSGWSGCSVQCGAGTQTQTRTCTNPSPNVCGQGCAGDSTETKACNIPCASDGNPCTDEVCDPANGCGTTNNTASCGTFTNGSGVCSGGSCSLQSCDSGFGNCDGNEANGCEVNLNTDDNHCGSCSNVCDPWGLMCSSGQCVTKVSTCGGMTYQNKITITGWLCTGYFSGCGGWHTMIATGCFSSAPTIASCPPGYTVPSLMLIGYWASHAGANPTIGNSVCAWSNGGGTSSGSACGGTHVGDYCWPKGAGCKSGCTTNCCPGTGPCGGGPKPMPLLCVQ